MDKAAGLTAEAAEKAETGRVRTHSRQHEVAAKEGLTKMTSGSPANYCSQLFLFLHVD